MVDHWGSHVYRARGFAVPAVAGVIAVALALTATPRAERSAATGVAPSSAARAAPPATPRADPFRFSLAESSPTPPLILDGPTLVAVQELLGRRASAVIGRDVDAYANTGGGSDTARSQGAAIISLPIAAWSYELGSVDSNQVVNERATLAAQLRYGPAAYVVTATLRYRLEGYDRSTVSTAHDVTVVNGRDGWRIVAERPIDGSKEIWDFGPLTIINGQRSMVVGLGASSPSTASLQAYADAADVAVRSVTAVWGRDWQRRVVVIAPPTVGAFARALGRDSANYTQIAAVTTAQLGSAASVSRGDRVFVNPRAFAKFGPRGRSIVLRHEITHVASTAAAVDSMPTWMEEGFADYVGYRGSGVPRSAIVSELAQWVADGNRPTTLPADDAYDGRNPHLIEAYEQSWLAATSIADRYGQAKLVELYRTMHAYTAGDPTDGTDRAFRAVLGISFGAFTRQWRAEVRALGA